MERTLLKNQKRRALPDLLSAPGLHIELNSNGGESVALSSGFELTKKNTPVGPWPKTVNLTAKDGENLGEIDLKNDALEGSNGYTFQYTSDPLTPTSVWLGQPSSKSKTTVRGLVSGQKYWFRSAGISTDGSLNYCAPISRIAQ